MTRRSPRCFFAEDLAHGDARAFAAAAAHRACVLERVLRSSASSRCQKARSAARDAARSRSRCSRRDRRTARCRGRACATPSGRVAHASARRSISCSRSSRHRLERRLDGEHLIEEGRLGRPPSGSVSSTCDAATHAALRDGGDGVARRVEVCASIAEVRSERNVGDLAHGAERRKRPRAVSIPRAGRESADGGRGVVIASERALEASRSYR